MTRLIPERRQVCIYLAAIGLGLGAGSLWPGTRPAFEWLLWPALVALLSFGGVMGRRVPGELPL